MSTSEELEKRVANFNESQSGEVLLTNKRKIFCQYGSALIGRYILGLSIDELRKVLLDTLTS